MNLSRSRVGALTSWALWSLRVGIESVGLGWLVVVLLTVAVSMATSSLSAAAALSAGEALRAGTALWGLGFGGMVTSSSADQGTLGLPLLGLTLAQVAWTWNCVRRARPTRPLAGAAIVVAATTVGVVAVFMGAGRVSVLHDALSGGGVVAMAGLVLLQLAWVPTMLIWACSWLIGAGFSVGTGTVFAPDRVVAGPVPTLPLLGLLPTAPLSTLGLWLPLVVTVGAMVAAWRRRAVLNSLRVRHAVSAAGTAALLVAVGVGLLCLAASGSMGPGRMTDVGPQVLYTVILVFVEVGVGLAAMAILAHPYTRTWARGALPESRLPVSRRAQEATEADGDPQDAGA